MNLVPPSACLLVLSASCPFHTDPESPGRFLVRGQIISGIQPHARSVNFRLQDSNYLAVLRVGILLHAEHIAITPPSMPLPSYPRVQPKRRAVNLSCILRCVDDASAVPASRMSITLGSKFRLRPCTVHSCSTFCPTKSLDFGPFDQQRHLITR